MHHKAFWSRNEEDKGMNGKGGREKGGGMDAIIFANRSTPTNLVSRLSAGRYNIGLHLLQTSKVNLPVK